jgi:limonene-1,2-epoxide hydrolase
VSTNTSASESAIEIVSRLCMDWPKLAREDFHKLLSPDCVYVNMPLPKGRCIGPDQAYHLISSFRSRWKMDLRLIHVRGDNEVVLTERLERFESLSDAGNVVELHVMGAFELKDGKIAHWRDYFDSKDSQPLTA